MTPPPAPLRLRLDGDALASNWRWANRMSGRAACGAAVKADGYGLGARAAQGSGLIATAIVGGAVLPPLTGALADQTGSLALALVLPAGCYLAILAYGVFTSRHPVAAG